MSFTKERTGSLGSVALRRPRRETDPESLAEGSHGMGASTASERTFMSTAGNAPRPGQQQKGIKSSRTTTTTREQPSYRLEPGEGSRFSPGPVEQLVQGVLVERLRDQTYDAATCKQLSQELAAAIMEELKALNIRRYKMVAVVSIGSLSERPGLQFGSRCLWDDATDSFASVKFTNGSLFAVAMIYGLYYE